MTSAYADVILLLKTDASQQVDAPAGQTFVTVDPCGTTTAEFGAACVAGGFTT
jgi:hypothetical protein